MYCNKVIQDELNEVMCPFCYKRMKGTISHSRKMLGKTALGE